ncbi:MAG: prolipoprotein diacylglyceryl transferase [Acidobacteria bacterium]|nr:prolipoprotein diacylglyceryl transferase [Acidobacteriota bacterium]
MHSVFHLGPVALPVFGVIAAVGLVCSLLLAEWNARVVKLDRDAVWNVCLTAIIGTLVISRAVLVLQSPRAFVGYPLMVLTLPTVTRFGLIAALVCGLGYALYKRMPLLTLADALAPAAMLLAAFVHLGDFFAGEDIGVATTNVFGRIVPSLRGKGALAGVGSYPVALYAAIISLLIAAAGVAWLYRRHRVGEVLGGTLILAASARFLLDLIRFHGLDAMPRFGLYLSQWVLLLCIVAGGVLLMERKEERDAL